MLDQISVVSKISVPSKLMDSSSLLVIFQITGSKHAWRMALIQYMFDLTYAYYGWCRVCIQRKKMGYWKSTVVPKFKKLFEKNNVKKEAAAEACKSFDDAKEDYNKEFEEKKTELQAKVLEIYEVSATEIKAVVKERKEGSLKKLSTAVEKFLDELSKIEFPGSKAAHEACSKYGAPLVQGPVFFVFEKVSTFIVVEEKKEEETPAAVEETSSKDKEIVVEEEKKEEVVAEAEKTPETTPATAEEAIASDPPKAS